MGSQENKLINLYIELRDGLRDLGKILYNTMNPCITGITRTFQRISPTK